MPQTCSICKHPQRLEIERAIVAGTSLRTIAGQFGPSKTAVLRHRTHVVEAIARSTEARELVRTGTLLEDVRAGERRIESLVGKAEEIRVAALRDNDQRSALQAIRTEIHAMGEARGLMMLRGELTNELGRDRVPAAVSIQIVCPSAPRESMPKVVFGDAPLTLEVVPEPDDTDPIAEIGLIQL
jgi:hypothetical protein